MEVHKGGQDVLFVWDNKNFSSDSCTYWFDSANFVLIRPTTFGKVISYSF